ncbi:MAG TPA: prolyl oligopeptidase family serine peptidase [Caulobacteraceae bacterium]|jgi:prolyl oligopeptidase|nr:prolyl oligopeptidase family serine peptidase [Caulobacteraceae bacterium]
MKISALAGAAALSLLAAAAAQAADPLAAVGVGRQPPPPPVKPVTETLWGVPVTDNYRYMENLGPATIAWMKAEGAYTRTVFDHIKPLSALEQRVHAFTGSFGFVQGYGEYGGRRFYEERTPGADTFDLVVEDQAGKRKIVDMAALRAQHGGAPMAINYALPSYDGSKVAVGISSGGSEAAKLFVYDAASGAQIAGPIDRADFGPTSWSLDSSTLYFIRLKKLGPSDPGTEKYRDASLETWDLKSEPAPIYGSTTGHGPDFGHDETPGLVMTPTVPVAALLSQNGVQNEIKAWTAPVAEAANPGAAHWTLLVNRDDGVTGIDARGDDLFLLSHKDAPTFKVLELKAGAPLASAVTLVPVDPRRVIEGVHAAADALYVLAREGNYSQLLRIPAGSHEIEQVTLPAKGHLSDVFTDPRVPGVTFALESWVMAPTTFHYDPASRHFADLHLGVKGDMNPADYVVSDLQAKGHDGVMIPYALIRPKGAKGPGVTVAEAYGSYGISNLADFSTRRAAMMREGINYVVCSVRGGGELGEAWRLGGKDANKPNTWKDLISCGEDLIARGVTTRHKLVIIGGSAGGITMGRAMTDRPDLFAAVLDLVPAANTLRAEFSPNGPDNIPEFGSIKTEAGFHNLLAMDSIQHVKKGVTYPAVMIATGLNDPRVSPWEPAKFAAALMASGDPNPVLLRVDEQNGHGIGQTRTQADRLIADGIAFSFWRTGRPGWRP